MDTTPDTEIIPVVGIGASAGGLKAFENFFSNMPSGKGAAIVIIQHLDPNHNSLLAEIINRYTEMDVFQIKDGVEIQPNTVYIIPPNKDVGIKQGTLRLSPPTKFKGRHLAIDTFFRSLKDDLHERAIGVILSGTGSDGTLGIKEIKEAGGLTLVQTPSTAQYDGMPLNAIRTGLIDFVIPVEEMPAKIIDYIDNQFKAQPLIDPDDEQAESYINQIFELIRKQTGHDFTNYKRNTIHRRLERRLNVNQIPALKEYVTYLKQEQREIDTLFKELLISVTSFFRDEDTFKFAAEAVVPQLVSQAANNEIRIWTPACATGEEAYSWAILLREHLDKHKLDYRVQVFASDIDLVALDKAREGRYTDNILADVPQHLLDGYFLKEAEGYRIKKAIREMIIFAAQNVVQDPPYSRLDLVSCRNFLIYLNDRLQQQALGAFHYALNPNGFLLLGNSEALGKSASLFKVFNRKYKLFQKSENAIVPTKSWRLPQTQRLSRFESTKKQPAESRLSLEQLAQKLVLDRFTPPSVIINKFDEILYVQGRTGKYLELTTGELSSAITKIAREGLKIALANAIRKAKATRQEVSHQNLAVKVNDHYEYIDLIVAPIGPRLTPEGWLLVVFQPSYSRQSGPVGTRREEHPPESLNTVVELEKELAVKEEYLKSTIEELETTNEELKSANEEALSTNEEMQSTNEELETSREELQSLNEELVTTNSELQSNLQELSRVNSLLQNLLASTQIATIFLDRQLRIFEFTPAIANIIDLRRSDFGRSIKQFTHNLEYGTLTEDAGAVLHNLIPKEVEVKTNSGQYYWMRIIPYRTIDDAIEGVVITFTDITEKKKQEEELEKHRHHLEQLVEEKTGQLKRSQAMLARTEKLAHVGSWEWHIASDTVTWSKELFRIFGLDSARDAPSFAEHPKFYPPETMAKLQTAVEAAVNHGTPYEMEMEGRRDNGDLFYCHVQGYPEWGPDGNVARLFGSFQDITQRKKAELALQEREATFRNIANNIPGLVLRYKLYPDGSDELIFLSKGVEDTYEIPREKALADVSLMWQMIHPDDIEEYSASVQASADSLIPWEREHRILLPDGRVKWLRGRGVPRKEADGSVVWDTLGVDITERKEAELALKKSEEKFRQLFEFMPVGITVADADGQIIDTNQAAEQILGVQKLIHEARSIDDPAWQIIDEDGSLIPVEAYPSVRALKEKQLIRNIDMGVKKNSGEVTWFNVSATPLVSDPEQVVVAYLDITEKVMQEQELARALREKEILLKEIHHRVKNNLQIISSMLNLQSTHYGDDERSVKIFKDSQNRIRAMALIHEKLYQSRDLGRIDSAEYINSLARFLFKSYGSDAYNVVLRQDIISIMLNIDLVVPCGLIINELVTNAIKHAFPREQSGEMVISLREQRPGHLALSVSNRGGLPFPTDLDFRKMQSLGLQLVNALVTQLDGEITLETGDETTFTVTFPHSPSSQDIISIRPKV